MDKEKLNIPEALHAARGHQQAGRGNEAVKICTQILAIDPERPEVHNQLGLALASLKRFPDALAAYQQALKLRPNYPEGLRNISVILLEGGAPEEAVRALEHAVKLEPSDAATHTALGQIYNLLNRPDVAAEKFQTALQLLPEDPKAQMGLANALEFLGNIDDAKIAYRHAIEVKPDLGAAYGQLVSLETPENIEALIPAMEKLLLEPELDPIHQLALNFALGRAYDASKKYDQAFEAYAKGCALKRTSIKYDVSYFESLVDRITEVFDTSFLAQHAGGGCPSQVPVFVIGMPRSGTSMVEQILASHSQVFGAGELNTLDRAARMFDRPDGPTFPETHMTLEKADFEGLGGAYVNQLADQHQGHSYVIDKTPTNFLYAGFLRLILPNARVIHCVRNPMDTCVSCHNLLFGIGQEYSYNQEELGRFYRAYARLMEHFDLVMPGKMLKVRYEDVVESQEFETKRMLEFLDLPWEDACLAFHKTERSVLTSSSGQVRRPLYKSSVARWKRYEGHLGPLIEALGTLVEDT